MFNIQEIKKLFFCYPTYTKNENPNIFGTWNVGLKSKSNIPINQRHDIHKLFKKFTEEEILNEINNKFELG